MVHKKFIKKGDKVFGPYYYENKREDGKVVTRYVGRDSDRKDSRKFTFWVLLFFVLLFVSAFAISDRLRPTGRISFDVLGGIYEPGEKIGGRLEFYFSGGELVPEDSLIIIEADGMTKEVLFSSVASGELIEGKFYAEGADLEGSGKGYGVIGKKEVYPEVEFEILVYSDESEDAESEDAVETPVEPEVGDSQEPPSEPVRSSGGSGGGSGGDAVETPVEPEPPVEEVPEEPISPGVEAPEEPGLGAGTGEGAGITGLVVTGEGTVVSGVVVKGSDFTYSLASNEKARLVSGSVKVNGKDASDDIVSFSSKDEGVVVSTDYHEEEEGFGEDYFDKEISKTILIDLHDLNLFAEESVNSIDVALVHSGIILAQARKNIIVKESIVRNNESIPGANESVVNETGNATYDVQTVQHRAVLGQPVKWSKRVSFSENPADKVVVEFSDDVEDVKVAEVIKRKKASPEQGPSVVINVSDDGEEIRIDEDKSGEDLSEDEIPNGISITGEVTVDLKLSKESNVLENFVVFLRGLFGPTGRVVSEISAGSPGEVVEEVTIEYFTDAPYAVEEEREDEKEVKIVGPESIHYQEVLAYSDIPEKFDATSPGTVKIFWQEQAVYILPEIVSDKDGNGIYDYVEWIVPQLSNQTFIIEIVKAEHLDSDRQFVSDIFNEVNALDGIWSEAINGEEYVRVTFERNLTSENDITIYPRIVNGTPSIEIYEANGSEIIARFDSLAENQYNKVYLSNLVGSQDAFDLKIVSGSVEFDHIIDPTDLPPDISFISPTPNSGETVSVNSFIVNVSSSDALTSHYAFTDFDSDLVLWIRMDDLVPETTNPDDLSSYGNDGATQGNAAQATGGKYGSRFVFDGSGDYISLGGSSSISVFDINSTFSVSAWVNFNNTGSIKHVVSDVSVGGVGWVLQVNQTTGRPRLLVGDGTTTGLCEIATDISDNEWHHITGTYNSGVIGCGLDGTYNTGDTYSGGSFKNSVGNSIGSLHAASALRAWNGSIDEVMIFNRSLSNAELSSLFNATSTQYEHNFSNLSNGNYNFTAYAVDIAGNKNNTDTRLITVSVQGGGAGGPDISPPNVNITFPAGITYHYNHLPLVFNVTLNENGGSVSYSLDGGINNVTMSTSDSRTYTASNSSISSGDYTFRVYVNDSFGNRNDTESVAFSINTSLLSGCTSLLESKTYYLNGSFFSPTSSCFDVNASNVVFDGKGFTMGQLVGFGANDKAINVFYPATNFTLVDLNVSSYDFSVFYSYPGARTGENGTTFTIRNSGLTGVSNDGNLNASIGAGGSGGSIYLYNSNITLASARGGSGANAGGNGGLIYLENSVINLNSASLNVTQGVSTGGTPASAGSLTINYTSSFTDTSADYGVNMTLILINGSSSGAEVRWLNTLDSSALTGIGANSELRNNYTSVDESVLTGLNRPANITFYNMSGTFVDPAILKDGAACGDCYNFTSLNAATVIFNVTGFSTYEIGETPNVTQVSACGALSEANTVYNVTADIIPSDLLDGPCLDVTAQNVTIEGNGFTIGESTFSYDVIYSNQKYTSVRNVNLTRATGLSSNGEIYFAGANHSNVTGVTFSNGNTGLVLSSTYHSYFDGNTFATSDRGVHFIATSGNNTFNVNSFEGGNYGVAVTGDGNTIKNTNLSSADVNAIYLSGSHNSFYNVRITDSVQTAVYLASGDNNTFNSTTITGTDPSYYDIDFVSSNGTNLIDSIIGKYTLNAAGSTLRVVDSEYGEVRFLNPVNGSGGNFTGDISFTDNLINVRSDLNLGLNRSANVSLVKFALPESFGLYIFRNGFICSDCYNFTSEEADPVIFNVTGFTNYSVGALPLCLSLDTCKEGGDCVIDRDCRLNSNLCVGGICQFDDLTFNGDIYTNVDENGNALDLDINLSGQILFSSQKGVRFSGEDGANIGSNGSIVNITMPPTGLFNRTNAKFVGTGGDGLLFGGNGGTLQINYDGLVGLTSTWSVNLGGGSGASQTGSDGTTIQNKYLNCPRDADVDNSGEVGLFDINTIRARYNNVSTDSGFSNYNDINCDGKVNVVELSRIGFEFERGFIL